MSSSRALLTPGSRVNLPIRATRQRTIDSVVAKRLACGHPEKIGYVEYRCRHCGQGKHLVAMRCKASWCLRCAQVARGPLGQPGEQWLHEGGVEVCGNGTKLPYRVRIKLLKHSDPVLGRPDIDPCCMQMQPWQRR
jgi:hypothetical protein